MSDRETGVEEARKVLGKLVDDAAIEGEVTYLTRRGRRYAAIVPLDRIKETPVLHAEKLGNETEGVDVLSLVSEYEDIIRKRDRTT